MQLPVGIPAEDPQAWANDCCFLTQASRKKKGGAAAAAAAVGSLACVARVTSDAAGHNDDGDDAPDLAPRFSLWQRITRGIGRGIRYAYQRLTSSDEAGIVAQFGPTMDLSGVPVDQLRIALAEAIRSGDDGVAANVAAQLARRRESAHAPGGNNSSAHNSVSRQASVSSQRNILFATSPARPAQQQQTAAAVSSKPNPFVTGRQQPAGRGGDGEDASAMVPGSLWTRDQLAAAAGQQGRALW